MSWGALPWWVYELEQEQKLALMSGAFNEEWFSGTSKVMPEHVINISKATFSTWKYGGWNYQYTKEEIAELHKKKN
jgi:hypothetical protein